MRFKLAPLAHQRTALCRILGEATIHAIESSAPRAKIIRLIAANLQNAFALLMEQRTGKTKVIIDVAAILYHYGFLDNLLAISLNVVHIKWVEDEIPKHMSDDVPYVAKFYRTSRKNKPMAYEPGKLRILSMSYDSFVTKDGFKYAQDFIKSGRTMAALDESQRIKDKNSNRAKAALKIAGNVEPRLILTGTVSPNGPFDIWSQFCWLDPSILSQTFAAFRAEYSTVLTVRSGLMQHILKSRPDVIRHVPKDPVTGKLQWDKLPAHISARLPTITANDADGNPIYRNLEKLHDIIAPHSYRVLRKDCFDLPPQIPDTLSFEMTDYQERVYNQVKTELRMEFGDKIMMPANKMVAMIRLQQITAGILMMDGDENATFMFHDDDNPRLIALRSLLEDNQQQCIIWARYNAEIDAIMNIIGDYAVQYDGRVKQAVRSNNVKLFQAGTKQYFVGKQQSGGAGLTLFAAKAHIYYSNTFSLEHRLQSMDRAEGIGQTDSVQITDIQAMRSIDLRIISSLQAKRDVASAITGDDL